MKTHRNKLWQDCVRDLTGACVPQPAAEEAADQALREKGVDCTGLSPKACANLRAGKRP